MQCGALRVGPLGPTPNPEHCAPFFSVIGIVPAGSAFFNQGPTEAGKLKTLRVLMSGGSDRGVLTSAVHSMSEAASPTEFEYADL